MFSSLPLDHRLSATRQNQRLFSDPVLVQVVTRHPDYEEALTEAESFLDWLRRRYARERKSLSDYREQGLEGHWFRPILRRLGHVFTPEPVLPGAETYSKRPDYVFYPDQASRREAEEAQDGAALAQNALAVGEVKCWDMPLGKKPWPGGPGFEDQNPSWQIDQLCSAAGVDWGLLSNGRLWRLVHRDTAARLDTYYQVDLVAMMGRNDPDELLYFTLFFRRAAFVPNDRGQVFLDDVLARSASYAQELKRGVADNARLALQALMQGFLDHAPNRLGPSNLTDVYENSLYLLYRLLFILCAESRGLLPLHYEQYRAKHSLARIRQEIVDLETPSRGTTLYWGQLKNLFKIVNGNYPKLNLALGVPRYDGGLFDPQQHRFLEQNAVGDRVLVQVIDLLSRRTRESGAEFVDYRALSAGHVGSVYEGLLSCRPCYAKEPMAAVADGEGRRWVPAAEVPSSAVVIEQCGRDEVYLEGFRHDGAAATSRAKAAVVETVVERTIGPVLARAIARAEDAPSEARQQPEEGRPGRRIVDEVLSLKIVDPAMGSGRLLVEATHTLARSLTTHPEVRAAQAEEDDLSYWKRRVVERSIYGVDENLLSVELAKLSLWLSTVAADRPLSFLDHHLVRGNALIGAQVDRLGWPPPCVLRGEARRQATGQRATQINMFDHLLRQTLPGVIGQIMEITREESKDYGTVQYKQAADRYAQQLRAPFEAVADLWMSAYFGNTFARGEYEEALGVVSQPGLLFALEPVRRARELADEVGFFHWELAFPEAFYDERGQPLGNKAGFDAVVSDPPQDQAVSDEETAFFEAVGLQRGSSADTPACSCFVRQVLRLASERGRVGLFLPGACLSEESLDEFFGRITERGGAAETVDLRETLELGEDVPASILLVGPSSEGAAASRRQHPAAREARYDESQP